MLKLQPGIFPVENRLRRRILSRQLGEHGRKRNTEIFLSFLDDNESLSKLLITSLYIHYYTYVPIVKSKIKDLMDNADYKRLHSDDEVFYYNGLHKSFFLYTL